jgi:predicted AAA+ superfamily ATPase
LLTDLFIVEPLPAWRTNRLQRLTHGPKRYLVDPSLMGAILRADSDTVMRDTDLIGRLIDSFVVSQLRAELEVSESRPRLYHLREQQGRREVDLLSEIRGGRIVACEIKGSASPGASDARHLTWLRDQLGDRFVAGIVFHTGPATYALGERITALPICTLWGQER